MTFSITNKYELTQAYWNRAIAREKLNNIINAIDDVSKVVTINPDYAEAYFYRGKLELTAGDKVNACNDFNKALEMDYK